MAKIGWSRDAHVLRYVLPRAVKEAMLLHKMTIAFARCADINKDSITTTITTIATALNPLAAGVMAATSRQLYKSNPMEFQDLKTYPEAIAQLQHQLLAQSQTVRRLKDLLSTYDREIDHAVAFDSNLKNDTQRKVRRAELMADEEYQATLRDLQAAQDKLSEHEIERDSLVGMFSIARLEMRMAIAQIEATTAA